MADAGDSKATATLNKINILGEMSPKNVTYDQREVLIIK